MKRFSLFSAIITAFVFSINVDATLYVRGGGLIYDDVLNVTWLQDANYAMTTGYDLDGAMHWDIAMQWVQELEYFDPIRNVTFSDWRLPTILPVNPPDYDTSLSFDGSTDIGYNIADTNSELGYMYYVNLGNLSYRDTEGNAPQPGWHTLHSGPFINIQDEWYWSGSFYPQGPDNAWCLYIPTGEQNFSCKYNRGLYAWAVRDGDVSPVPEPATILLLCSGIIGLAGLRRKFK